MSIDINWEALTSGEEGAKLASSIRDFINDKFEQVPLPNFLRSVEVVSFDFGRIAPDIEIKSISDPYPEFYEDLEDDDEDELIFDEGYELRIERERRRRERKHSGDGYDGATSLSSSVPQQAAPTPFLDRRTPGFRSAFSPAADSFRVPGVSTPLFAFTGPTGTTSNLHYFHSALSSSFTAGSRKPSPFNTYSSGPSASCAHQGGSPSSDSVSSPPSTADSSKMPQGSVLTGMGKLQQAELRESSPPSPDGTREPPSTPSTTDHGQRPIFGPSHQTERITSRPPSPLLREPREEDIQITARVRYSGDIKLEIKCELLFDYPARNFVRLPVRLVVTGLTFDGLAVLACIGKRLHFCFLEDDSLTDDYSSTTSSGMDVTENDRGGIRFGRVGGGMIKEIKVENEIGEKGKGKQVLKNVGKVERFVLEQVRRIFEDEFVFPSSWTFLI